MLKNDKERHLWKNIKPDMMSEEEECEDGFIRHRFSWRSANLNRFFSKLDRRSGAKATKALARKQDYGDAIEKAALEELPSWMVTGETTVTAPDELADSDDSAED